LNLLFPLAILFDSYWLLSKIVLSALPELSVQILEHAREHGRVTMSDMAAITGVSRNTLKKHFSHLVEKSHLVLHGSGRGAWYALP
jgi:predicted HTH transcriptional regulator